MLEARMREAVERVTSEHRRGVATLIVIAFVISYAIRRKGVCKY